MGKEMIFCFASRQFVILREDLIEETGKRIVARRGFVIDITPTQAKTLQGAVMTTVNIGEFKGLKILGIQYMFDLPESDPLYMEVLKRAFPTAKEGEGRS